MLCIQGTRTLTHAYVHTPGALPNHTARLRKGKSFLHYNLVTLASQQRGALCLLALCSPLSEGPGTSESTRVKSGGESTGVEALEITDLGIGSSSLTKSS